MQALADGFEGKFGLVLQSGVEGISDSKLNGIIMDVVLEDDESGRRILATEGRHDFKWGIWLPCIDGRSVSEDGLEGLVGLGASDYACSDLPVVGIKFASGGSASPHDGNETHC